MAVVEWEGWSGQVQTSHGGFWEALSPRLSMFRYYDRDCAIFFALLLIVYLCCFKTFLGTNFLKFERKQFNYTASLQHLTLEVLSIFS